MISTAVIISVSICGIVVYASGLGDSIVSKFIGTNTEVVNEHANTLHSENAERERIINEALTNSGVQITLSDDDENIYSNTTDKFSRMLIAMNATISDPVEYNDLLVNYEYLREVHQLSQSNLDYIADLIIDGCDMKDIISIAYFWLDTNDDISLIKQIYDLKGEYEGSRFWIEDSYDRVTKSKNGTLSVEDIENYFSKGMTAEDITSADKLCRKGVYTIREILEKRCEGQSFLQIINEIEGSGISVAAVLSDVLPADNTVPETYNSDELLKTKEISQLRGITQEEAVYSIAAGEYNADTYAEEYNNKIIEIRERLENSGLIKLETEVD